MERMVGYRRAIVIDALSSGAPAGSVFRLHPDERSTRRSASAHDVDLPTALAVGRRAGVPLPADDDILLVGIEAAQVETFGEDLSPAVAAAVPRAAAMVLAELHLQEEER
jgi:hydrogenase maturation protease